MNLKMVKNPAGGYISLIVLASQPIPYIRRATE